MPTETLEQFGWRLRSARMPFYGNGDTRPEPKSFGEYNITSANKELFEACRDFKAGGLTLSSLPGTGKTHLMEAMARRWLEEGKTAQYWKCGELIDQFRDWIAQKEPMQARAWAMFNGLLLLDDLGAERITEYSVEVITDIVDVRIARQLPFVVATNLGPKKVAEQFHERLASRLFQRNAALGEVKAVVLGDDAEDWRRKK